MKITVEGAWRLLLATYLAVGCAGRTAAQGDKTSEAAPKTTDAQLTTKGTIEHEQNQILFQKPIDWKCIDVESQLAPIAVNQATDVLSFVARTIPWGNMDVTVTLLTGSSANNRLQAIYERAGHIAKGYALDDKIDLHITPVPHQVFRLKDRPGRTELIVHRRANGYAMSVVFVMDNKHIEKARTALLQLAHRVTTKLAPWPPRPSSYEYESESGFELAFSPSTNKKRRKFIHKFVKGEVRRFTKLHGTPALPEGEPVLLFIEDDQERCAELTLFPGKEANPTSGFMSRRLVAPNLTPLDLDGKRACAKLLCGYMLKTLYPENGATWVYNGEAVLAEMEACCSKSLPYAPESWEHGLTRLRLGLDKLIDHPKEAKVLDPVGWVAFFRIGPSKYRKAYQALLKELRTASDPVAAMNRFRGDFDLAKLHKTARKTVRSKIKLIKVK